MMTLAIILVIIILIGILAVLVFIQMNKNAKNEKNSEKTKKPLTLEQLISIAKDTSSNREKLHECILTFLNTQKIGFRTSTKTISDDAKSKLAFVSAVSSNENADAKLITFLNRELNKRYPSYKKEIDAYEQVGLTKRKAYKN